MRKTTIRALKHETSVVLGWVAAGATVEVRRRNEPVAILSPPQRRRRVARPDFAARLRSIYGTKVLRTSATDLVAESRGDT